MLQRFFAIVAVAAGALAGAEHRGSVLSAGLPIPGAIVTAAQGDHKLVTSTDESGAYVFEDLLPGSWTIDIEAFGFEKSERVINVPADRAVAWDLKLKLPSAAPASVPTQAAKLTPSATPFQRLGVNQTAETDVLAALPAQPASDTQQFADLNQNATEAFLVNGSLSRGLQAPRQEGEFAPFGLFGPPGMPGAGLGPPGANPPGAGGTPGETGGEPGMRGAPGMGGGPAMGGPGMGGPGMGGPGMGGPGGFGGPGGLGGRQGVGERGGSESGRDRKSLASRRPDWQGRPGTMLFGNRANRGRESFRGDAFFNLRNSALDARSYSLTGQSVDKPSYAQARFGLTGGGQLRIPKLIQSDKTFIFLNYFGTRSRNPYNAVSTLPSAAERSGDFSQSIARGSVVVYDPLTGQPFPDNRIPTSRINPAANGLLSFFPLPNLPGRVQNYQFITSVPQNTDNLGLRLSNSLSRRDRISGSFNLQSRGSETTQLFGFRDTSSGRGMNLDLAWMHTLRPRLINNLRWNFSRNRNQTLPFFAYSRNVAAELGITGTSSSPINYGPPNLSFTNFGGLTDASSALGRNQSSAIAEGLTFVRGRHTWIGGAEYRRNQLNNRSDQNGRGAFTFSGIRTSAFDSSGQPLAGTGFDFADFLLGLPQSSSIRFGSTDTYFRGATYNAFLQDDWRLRPSLTLNIGLRYEFPTPLTEKYNRIANLDIAPGFTAVAPVTPGMTGPYTGLFPDALVNPDRNNFAPRVGLAWRPLAKHSLLVRAGYGWYYNGSVYNQAASRLAQQPPFANTATVNTSLARPLTLQDGFATAPSTQITNTYAVDRYYRAGYAQTWSLALQHDLPLSMVAEVGYLGTKGTRLDIQRLPNRATPGSPLTAEQRRQIGNATGFTFESAEGNSIYHAAQVRLARRFRRGISANALYTFSKSIDNASTFGGGGAVVAQDDKNLRAERGLSSFDQRHTLNLFYIFSSPASGSSSKLAAHGFTGHLVRNWTISGGITARSGSPFTATVLGNLSDSGGTGAVGSGRADATGLPVSLPGSFFNPAAFTLPPSGRFGNAARNTIPGPGSFSLNMAVGRSFHLDESRRSLELRMESTNTLNTVNITRIGTTVNASNYDLPLSAGPMRTMQASLRFRF